MTSVLAIVSWNPVSVDADTANRVDGPEFGVVFAAGVATNGNE